VSCPLILPASSPGSSQLLLELRGEGSAYVIQGSDHFRPNPDLPRYPVRIAAASLNSFTITLRRHQLHCGKRHHVLPRSSRAVSTPSIQQCGSNSPGQLTEPGQVIIYVCKVVCSG